MTGERRRGGVLSSGNRVEGFMPHLLGARWRLGAVLDLEACAVGVVEHLEELRRGRARTGTRRPR